MEGLHTGRRPLADTQVAPAPRSHYGSDLRGAIVGLLRQSCLHPEPADRAVVHGHAPGDGAAGLPLRQPLLRLGLLVRRRLGLAAHVHAPGARCRPALAGTLVDSQIVLGYGQNYSAARPGSTCVVVCGAQRKAR